jgi:hypothetical protein
MPRRKTLTQLQVTELKRKAKRYNMADPVQLGLILRVPPASSTAPVSYYAVMWDKEPTGERKSRQRWERLGTSPDITLAEARAKCVPARIGVRQQPLGKGRSGGEGDQPLGWLTDAAEDFATAVEPIAHPAARRLRRLRRP